MVTRDSYAPPSGKPELAILVLDGSGSMAGAESSAQPGSKADRIRKAIADPNEGLIRRHQSGARVNEVEYVILVYDDTVEVRKVRTRLQDITDMQAEYDNLDLLNTHGRETDIVGALDEAGRIASDFFADSAAKSPKQVTVLLMTDGAHNVGVASSQAAAAAVLAAAEKLKGLDDPDKRNTLRLACAPYGEDADRDLLRSIASDPQSTYYKECKTAEEVRSFFIATQMAPHLRG